MVTKHLAELAKTILVDLEVVVPSMHSVRDIINSKMSVQDKFIHIIKAIGISLGTDATIDYFLP